MSRLLLILALAVVLSACASTGHTPQPFPRPGGLPPAPSPSGRSEPALGAPADTYGITGTALTLRGTPYRNGGSDPAGFDCSGFVWYVFGQHGVQMPRTVGELARVGTNVNGGVQPGDLVFFNTTGAEPSHVGIAIGGDEFIHAPSTNGEVRVERLGATYWAARFVGARRVL